MIKYNSQTKIVATMGPASSSKEILIKMILEGTDVFRLNFSHSNQEEHLKLINLIKEINIELNTNVSLLADLQGPKLRVGEIENQGIYLIEGELITFVSEKCIGTKNSIYMSYRQFSQDVNIGEQILIDDGKIMLEVVEANKKDKVKAKVIYGGLLKPKKGVNLPKTKISLPSLTEEDISNANFAIDNGVDWIALSFVRKASDILDLRNLIDLKKGHAGIIAKIEKPEALDEIDEIISLTDGVMIARGDLGVEVPFDLVPMIQKILINKCLEKSKPVIVATQMMESMIDHFRPTRAEAADVANAVLDGADALMLSGETSVGKYPVETINCMQKIIENAEIQGKPYYKENSPKEDGFSFHADSICYIAMKLSKQVKAKAIVAFTNSGHTVFQIASHRPDADIFAFTNNEKLLRKMSLVWGVRAFYLKTYNDLDNAIFESIKILKDKNLVLAGDCIVYVGSTPLDHQGSTNILKVSYV